MKTDKNNLEDFLADVEHAGRDARRQQELGAMIDLMAEESGKRKVESGRHGFWWWGARVAAAACVLFFITTAVRIWFIPTEPAGTMVAEAEVPAPPQRLPNDFPTTTAVVGGRWLKNHRKGLLRKMRRR